MKMIDEIKAAMNKPAFHFPIWDPKIEDIIVGSTMELRTVHTRFGEQQIIPLKTEDGLTGIWMSKVLHDEFTCQYICTGDDIAIMYKGVKKVNG